MSHKYLLKRRLKSAWQPCTQMKQQEASLDRGKGVRLHDFEDRPYLDAIRSVHSKQEMDLLAVGCRRLIHSKN